MADRKISDLTALTTPASGDYLPIVDISEAAASDKNKRITIEELMRGVPDGTVGAPGIAFESDPNTGIYSPGADQVAVATNGQGRLFVDANGKVGLGTATPGSYNILADNLVIVGTQNEGISIISGTNSTGSIWFGDADAQGQGRIVYSHLADRLTFSTGGTERLFIESTGQLSHIGGGSSVSPAVGFNGGAPSNSLVVDSLGKVGIGTSAPSVAFEVASATDNAEYMRVGPVTSASTRALRFSAEASSGGIANTTHIINAPSTAAFLKLQTNSTTALTIDTSQRVGIGSTVPQANLVVSNGGAAGLEINPIGFDSGPILQAFNRSTSAYVPINTYSSYVAFNTGTSAVERARIDTSGRLLVGTSSSLLSYANFQMKGGAGGASSANICLASIDASIAFGSDLGSVRFTNNSGNVGAQIVAQSDGTWSGAGGSDYPGRLVFSTTADGASSPTERMRINSEGVVHSLGYTDGAGVNAWRFRQGGSGVIADSMIETIASATSVRYHYTFRNGASSGNASGAIVGSISTSGSATSFTTSSDYRLKENVTPVSDGIARLQQLKPSRFNFIADPDTTVDGFLAHEVQTVVPEAITGEKDAVDDEGNPEYQGIDQSKLVPLLTAALQEAIAKIETLEQRLNDAGIN